MSVGGGNVSTVDQYKLMSSFERLRRTLLDAKYSSRMETPLVHWAFPSERWLPLAFLGRTLKELLSTPYDELMATPGVGKKKISALIRLLERATQETLPGDAIGKNGQGANGSSARSAPKQVNGTSGFDPDLVSEATWAIWRQTVRAQGLSQEKLGRLAPSLQELPTVIWHTPLGDYVDLTLAEMRQLKTHGEKRIRAILHVFWVVHEALMGSSAQPHLNVRLVPRFVPRVEQWLMNVLTDGRPPECEDIHASLVVPLIAQIEVDAGSTVWQLTAERLGLNGSALSVREQSRRMGVTRARVYQLLEDCAKVMLVRWPEGDRLLTAVAARVREGKQRDAVQLIAATQGLFFPRATAAPSELPGRLVGTAEPVMV